MAAPFAPLARTALVSLEVLATVLPSSQTAPLAVSTSCAKAAPATTDFACRQVNSIVVAAAAPLAPLAPTALASLGELVIVLPSSPMARLATLTSCARAASVTTESVLDLTVSASATAPAAPPAPGQCTAAPT